MTVQQTELTVSKKLRYLTTTNTVIDSELDLYIMMSLLITRRTTRPVKTLT